MGISYCIQMIFDAKLNKKNVGFILKRGKDLGCLFFESEKYDFLEVEKNIPLEVDIAVSKIFNMREETRNSGLVVVKKEDTVVLLSFDEENGRLSIDLTLFAYIWIKIFVDGQEEKDFARYINLLLTITQDFPIINLGIRHI